MSATRATSPAIAKKPVLVFLTSATSGRSRRAEGFLSQVLQHRRNHETFSIRRIDCDSSPELAGRLGIERPPAILVVEGSELRVRIDQVNNCRQLRQALKPWLK